MQNQFEIFYKQQIRKDLIDKLNVSYVQEVNMSCIISYKGYISTTPLDKNFKNITSISMAYLYILESIFCQKVVRDTTIKKNIQRDLPSTYFFSFCSTLRNNKVIFSFLQRLFILLFFQQKNLNNLSKSNFKFFFNKNYILLKNITLSFSPWVKKFRTLEKHNKLFSNLSFSCKNPYIFYWVISRFQFKSLATTNVPIQSQSLLVLKSHKNLTPFLKFKPSSKHLKKF